MEMLIEAKRSFISVRLGNIDAGMIVETDEQYGKHLIENGLAVDVTAGPSLSLGAESSFPSPVEAAQAGSSLQVVRASPEKIARSSDGGAKVTYKKGKSRS
jgi:hypothetical protein